MRRTRTLDLTSPGWESIFNEMSNKANIILRRTREKKITAHNLTTAQRQTVADAFGNMIEYKSDGELGGRLVSNNDIKVSEMIEGRDYTFGTKDNVFAVYGLPDDKVAPWSPGATIFAPPALPKHKALYQTLRYFGL